MTKAYMEIKRWDNGEILFSGEFESQKEMVEAAIKNGASLNRASLIGASLINANLDGASLINASLINASLINANLDGASLIGASLINANLNGASLIGASLINANLDGASLINASLINASLINANLDGAKGINKYICTPLMILLDQPGKIRAYKLIRSTGEGPFYPKINYLDQKEFLVEDADASDNQCAPGISLATLDWCMKEWQPGYRILIMEFTKKDIASIPMATDGKFRVFRCKRVGEKDLVKIGLISKEVQNA